jgi:hypothetical protein
MLIIAAVVFTAVHLLLRLDDPIAVVIVSDDPQMELTNDAALELTAEALRNAGLEPIRPIPLYSGPEPAVGRNAIRPADRVVVGWYVNDGRQGSYSVSLERDASSVVAEIHRMK